jgi:hypothetical protein
MEYLPSAYALLIYASASHKFASGGIYQAICCRDAAYILRDWFLSGNIHGTMQQIYQDQQIKNPLRIMIYLMHLGQL